MKKTLAIVLSAFMLIGVLAACGSSSSSQGPSSSQGEGSSSQTGGATGSQADYETVIRQARPEEINSVMMYDPITDIKEAEYKSPGEELITKLEEQARQQAEEGGEELSDEEVQTRAEEMIQRYLANIDYMFSQNFTRGDISRYAISSPGIITLAYGVLIILPEEGKTDDVMKQVEDYVEQQKSACEGYLAPQYEIAKTAIIEQAPTGEILLAMCEDARNVMDKMLAGLKA